MNYYLIEYHHDSEGYKYEEFLAEDQFEAVELCKAIPFCGYIQNVYMQVKQWEREEEDETI
jgi:hypothetical protein